GITLSDGYIQPTSKTSYSLRILLSQKYDWSKLLLKDVSNSLSMVEHTRTADTKRSTDAISELYSSSPLFLWIREIIFKLRINEKKTYSPIKAEWILTLPKLTRVAFLQGVADGDAYASSVSQRVGIGTLINKPFFNKLLDSLGVHSSPNLSGVEIFKHESIRLMTELPLFKNATSRLENLSELCAMLDARPKRKPVTAKEISLILMLHKSGLSYGDISLQLWRIHNISRSIATIGRIVRQNRKQYALELSSNLVP
ncbi:MAG: hypothetical protein ACTSWA_01955, partial [Candidatus Thorarchaeota archaeon]